MSRIDNPEWTTERPTVPGWYWLYVFEDHAHLPTITIRYIESWRDKIWLKSGPERFDIEQVVYWLGPVPEPDDPLEESTD